MPQTLTYYLSIIYMIMYDVILEDFVQVMNRIKLSRTLLPFFEPWKICIKKGYSLLLKIP